ncbi:MAG: DUF1501 domain-containing protein, partial [Planctomycetia bacterium]|nr:DUF1501 domain-containing protein [Planctomycetia bacterium]
MSDHSNCCPGLPRRSFLTSTGMGLAGVALQALLQREGMAGAADESEPDWAPPDGRPHRAPR